MYHLYLFGSRLFFRPVSDQDTSSDLFWVEILLQSFRLCTALAFVFYAIMKSPFILLQIMQSYLPVTHTLAVATWSWSSKCWHTSLGWRGCCRFSVTLLSGVMQTMFQCNRDRETLFKRYIYVHCGFFAVPNWAIAQPNHVKSWVHLLYHAVKN